MKKVLCLLLIISILICGNSFFVYSEENADMAYAEFIGKTPNCKDAIVSVGPGNEIMLYNQDGRQGWILNEGETVKNSRIDIFLNDKFTFENTNGTSYIVEVDYLDAESGHFNLVYDAYSMVDKETKPIYIGNTGEWKTAVYELDDAYFANRMNKGADLRIATYDATLTRASTANVVIGAVRIIKHNAKNPVRVLSIDTNVAGNIFGNGEEKKFTAKLINNTGGLKHLWVSFEAFDANNNLVWMNDCDAVLEGNETTDVSTICNVSKYGLYSLKVTVRGSNFKHSKTVPFSFVNNRLDGKKHSLFGYPAGFTSNVPGYEYDYKKALELYEKSGVSFIRDSMIWNKVDPVGKPKYTCEITEQYREIYDEIAKSKLDIAALMGLYGPINKYEGLLSTTHMPITEDAMKGYAEFCKFYASVCKERGINVLGYEIWNEPEALQFNKNATMQQVSKIAVNTSKALSEVDFDAPKKTSVSFCAGPYVDTYLQGLSANGYADWCRAIICHTYHCNSYPEDQRYVQYMRDYINKYEETLGKKPALALMTEYGRNRSYNMSRTEADKARLIMRDSVFIQKSGLFDKLAWYTLNQGGREDHGEDTYGDVASHNPAITDVPFAATDTYVAKTNYNNLMCEAEYERALANETKGMNAYLFNRPGDSVMTVWTADINKKYDIFSFMSEADSVIVYDIYGNSETVHSDEGIFTIPVSDSIKYIKGNISDAQITESEYLFYEDFEDNTTGKAPDNVYKVGSYFERENNRLTEDLAIISSETSGNKYLNIQDNADDLQNAVVYLNRPVSNGTVVLEFDGMIPNGAVLYQCHKAVKAGFVSDADRKDSYQIGIMVHEGKDGGSKKDNSVALYHYDSQCALGIREDINYAAKVSEPQDSVEFEVGKWIHYRVEVNLDDDKERVWVNGVISSEQHNLKLKTYKALDSFNFATTWKGRGAWLIDNIRVYKKNSLYTSPFASEITNDFGTIRADLIRNVNTNSLQLFNADGVRQNGMFYIENLKMAFVPNNKDTMIKGGVYYIKVNEFEDGTETVQKDKDFVYSSTGTKAKISIDNLCFDKNTVIEPSIKLSHDNGISGTILMFAAAYKGKRLISISEKTYEYEKSDFYEREVADGLSNILPEGADTIKVFVWNKDNISALASTYMARN